MQVLNLPAYDFRVKSSENKVRIFDIIRKKFVVLTPEEWVRQHVLHWLIYHKKYPVSLINVEKQLKINKLRKRYDLVVYNPDGTIELLVECKSYSSKITQEAFDQVARYNLQVQSNFLMVTNGMEHYYCKMEAAKEKYIFLEQIPDFSR